jgi:hypothetical protein
MRLKNTELVRTSDARPAGPPDRCFYCGEAIGVPHKAECVCLEKAVVMRVSFDVVVSMPDGWTEDEINFRFNGSSWCANNFIDDLMQWRESVKSEVNCACGSFTAEMLREATKEDLENVINLVRSEKDT